MLQQSLQYNPLSQPISHTVIPSAFPAHLHHHPAAPSAVSILQLLSLCFEQYSAILTGSNSGAQEAVAASVERWYAHGGLSGWNTPVLLAELRGQLRWEAMTPDTFHRFYRFVFHLLKESPTKRHIQVEIAQQAWQLLLAGRFRLLGKWCEFVRQQVEHVKVINEDQYSMVLEFSQTVHEDLGNFDDNGAWPWLIDEFVEHLRLRQSSSSGACQWNGLAVIPPAGLLRFPILTMADSGDMATDPSSSHWSRGAVSPRPGSKRRGVDLEVNSVTELLLAMPLTSSGEIPSSSQPLQDPPALMNNSKRHCIEAGASPPKAADSIAFFMQSLPAVQTSARRVFRTRRSGVADLVNETVSGALGLSTL